MSGTSSDKELSLKRADEAFALMRKHGPSGDPRAFEVWYSHASGQNQALSKAVSEALANNGGVLTDAALDHIHDNMLAASRFAAHAEKTSLGILNEIDTVMEMIDLALGSNTQYQQSLESMTTDLDGFMDKQRLRDVVGRLVAATKETVATNRTLEARLQETKSEIQDLRETLESIRTESLTDPLTTLANRKHLDNMLLSAVDHAALSGEPMSVLMVDVDRFKSFNDTWGHLTGDQVLRLVAMSIKGAVRPTDTAARFGGEEFAVILPATQLKAAMMVAERIRQTVMSRELVKRSSGEALGRLTVSIGCAAYARGDTAALLVERADRCLIEAKRTGRNKCVSETDFNLDMSDVA
jgi:diguanylate cyclase